MSVEDLLNTHVCATEKYDGQNLGVLYYPETDRFELTSRNYMLNDKFPFNSTFVKDYFDAVKKLYSLVSKNVAKTNIFAVYGELHMGDEHPSCVGVRNGFHYGECFWRVFGVRLDETPVFYNRTLDGLLDQVGLPHVTILCEGTVAQVVSKVHPHMMSRKWEGVVLSNDSLCLKYKVGDMDDHTFTWNDNLLVGMTEENQRALTSMLEVYQTKTTRPQKTVNPSTILFDSMPAHRVLIMSQLSKEPQTDLASMDNKTRALTCKRMSTYIVQDYIETNRELFDSMDKHEQDKFKTQATKRISSSIFLMFKK